MRAPPPQPAPCCRRGHAFGFCDAAWAAVAGAKNLSRREVDVARGLLAGRSERRMAQALGLGESTIHTHVLRLAEKLRVEGHVGIVTALFATHNVWLGDSLTAPPDGCPLKSG